MKRASIFALLLVGLTLPVCAGGITGGSPISIRPAYSAPPGWPVPDGCHVDRETRPSPFAPRFDLIRLPWWYRAIERVRDVPDAMRRRKRPPVVDTRVVWVCEVPLPLELRPPGND
jgi:hypothetical protein